MKTVWMEILRPGKWNEWDFPPDYLRDLVSSYDPEVREAPLVIGHPSPFPFDEEKPAHGWVKKLELRPFGENPDQDDISVWAFVELGDEAEAMIKDRKFPKRSAGISDEAPYPGIPYLKHVALLGASNPAVSSLTEVELAAGFTATDGILCLAQINGKDIELVWESKETEYWYRVRPPAKFRTDTFRSKTLTTGIRAVMAKHKPEYVPSGHDADSMVIQALRFDKSKFDLARAKTWVKEHKGELSQMSETQLVDEAEVKTLKAQNENLQKQLKEHDEKLLKEQERAETAEKKLRERELARLENQYELEIKSLVEEGNGAPAYIELGVHKALVAMDAADVKVKLESGEKSASEIILSALKAVPKFIEHKEVATQLSSGNGEGGDGKTAILRDNSFDRAMQGYADGGASVEGMDVKTLAEKLMSEDKELDIYNATLQASKTLAARGDK